MTKLIITIGLLFTSVQAFAGWMANADFSSCPRKYIPNTSGSEGPFNSESECQSRISQVRSQSNLACARYSCVNQAGGSSESSGPAAPGHEMDKGISDALAAGMQGKITPGDTAGLVTLGVMGNLLLAPKPNETPEQAAARIQAEQRARLEAEQRTEAARQKEAAYQNAQDQNALNFMGSVVASLSTPVSSKPQSQNFRSKLACKGGEPGLHTCYVMVCGGAYGGDPVCCPEGFPKLNECDCNCYPSEADFECKRYAACQYSYKLPDANGGKK